MKSREGDGIMAKTDKVWYACYGSNLSADRFRAYIEGTVNPANGIRESGCSDRSLWTDTKVRTFRGQLYFAKSSRKWEHGGVAFIDPDADGTIYMRIYLITREQFLEVQDQEGAWYSRRVDLGVAEDGNPIYTFTAPYRYRSNLPSHKYRDWIESALVNECGLPSETAKTYLNYAIENG